MEETKNQRGSTAYAWLVFVLAYLAWLCAPLGQTKVATLSEPLMATFNMSTADFGMLSSSLTIMAVILAIPAAWIVGRMGIKTALITSVGFLGVGSLIGVFAPSSGVLLFSRAIEGCGISFAGVAAPTAISMWFPEGKRGLPLGLWCTGMPLGSTVSMLIVPQVAASFGWQGAWWMCVIACAIVAVLIALLYKDNEASDVEQGVESQKGFFVRGLKYLKGKDIWLLCIAFLCFNLVCNGVFMSYYPMYLQQGMGMTPAEGGAITSIMPILTICIMPIMGIVYDKVGRRKPFVLFAFAACAVTLGIAFMDNLTFVWIAVIVFGLMGGLVASGTRPMTPEIMERTGGGALAVAMGMSVMQIAQNLGPTIGAPLFGMLVDSSGWMMASVTLCVPLAIVGFIALVFMKAR